MLADAVSVLEGVRAELPPQQQDLSQRCNLAIRMLDPGTTVPAGLDADTEAAQDLLAIVLGQSGGASRGSVRASRYPLVESLVDEFLDAWLAHG